MLLFSSSSGYQTNYFDGEYKSYYTPAFTTNNVTITSIGTGYGSAHASYGSYFDGYISNFKYYNKPLTASETSKNYNTQKGRFGK